MPPCAEAGHRRRLGSGEYIVVVRVGDPHPEPIARRAFRRSRECAPLRDVTGGATYDGRAAGAAGGGVADVSCRRPYRHAARGLVPRSRHAIRAELEGHVSDNARRAVYSLLSPRAGAAGAWTRGVGRMVHRRRLARRSQSRGHRARVDQRWRHRGGRERIGAGDVGRLDLQPE